jgi:hypothetical protein
VFLYQYANEANPQGPLRTTGPEIWATCPEITHFVAGLGTSGTLMGVGTFLKEQNPDIKVIAVEPPLGERVEGLRNLDEGYIPPVFEKWGGPSCSTASASCGPASRSSGPAARRVGIFSGISAGAALAGAVKVAERDRVGHHRVHRVRRRLEVPLHRRLDRRPRRGRRAGREDHLLLSRFAHEITAHLVDDHDVKFLIVACNTASAALDLGPSSRPRSTGAGRRRDRPGVRALVEATADGRIGVIGTVGTIGSGAYQKAVAGLAAGGRSRARRVPASSSSSSGASSPPTRSTCWPSGCWRRCVDAMSTRCCSAARTIRTWPARSAT